MVRSDAAGLPDGMMAFWASIEPQEQAAYERWHNAEHIPERLAINGFARGARYRSVKDDARFLMFYETTGADVLASPGYLQALNSPTARTRQALAWFRNPVRNVYRLLAATGQGAAVPAPLLATVKFAGGLPLQAGLSRGGLETFDVQRIAVYEIEPTGSSVRTNESSLHGAASASAGGLLRIESGDLRLLDDPRAWSAFASAVEAWCGTHGIRGLDDIEIGSIDYCQIGHTQENA